MQNKNLLVFLVGVLAIVLAVQTVSAFGSITRIEVNGIDATSGVVNFATFSGETIDVDVRFDATANAEDVRLKAWISGESENAVVSSRQVVYANGTYSFSLEVPMPSDLDEFLADVRKLEIVVESKQDGTADEETVNLRVQRESYEIQVLSVSMDSQVMAGEPLLVDVVLKNRGIELAEDTYVKVRIPELGLETQSYFGDLSAVDQSNPDKEDAVERRAFLRIPASAKAGVYTVLVEAYNSDSVDRIERKILVVGAEGETMVVPSTTSKTFSTDEDVEYTLTIVNSGSQVRVYELDVVAPSDLSLDVSEPVVVVPAGSSRSVTLTASSNVEGRYAFTVNVISDGQVIDSKAFSANVEGNGVRSGTNTTVLLTVVLAIIFVVLLVVLIVLLTRKPDKQEEFSESSYY